MKKLVLFAVAAVALSFASCSNKANQTTTPAGDTTSVVLDEEVIETTNEGDSLIEETTEEVVEEVKDEAKAE